jgi:hypothetical protein
LSVPVQFTEVTFKHVSPVTGQALLVAEQGWSSYPYHKVYNLHSLYSYNISVAVKAFPYNLNSNITP